MIARSESIRRPSTSKMAARNIGYESLGGGDNGARPAYTRIHAAVAAEWRLEVAARLPRPRHRWFAIAAGLAAATVIGASLLQMFARAPTLGIVGVCRAPGQACRFCSAARSSRRAVIDTNTIGITKMTINTQEMKRMP